MRRSSWIIWVDPKSNESVLIRRGGDTGTAEEPCEGKGRDFCCFKPHKPHQLVVVCMEASGS